MGPFWHRLFKLKGFKLSNPRSDLQISTFATSSRFHSKSGSGSGRFLLVGLLSGTAFGFAVGFLLGKYPFIASKIGVGQNVDTFLMDPQRKRSQRTDDTDKYLRVCEAVAKIAEYAVLSTLSRGEDGVTRVESRPIAPFPINPGLNTIHFSSNRLSRKMKQLEENPQASITYLDSSGVGYVTAKGRAKILDRVESAALWRDELFLFYPEGPLGTASEPSRYVVIEFEPERIEFSSARFKTETAYDSWLPPALIRDDGGNWMVSSETKINTVKRNTCSFA